MKRGISLKIKSIEELEKIIGFLKSKGKKIAHCHGVFDLLHPGHIKHLEAAKRKADVLVVTITRDEYVNKGPGRPIFNHDLRAESVAAVGCVDYVAVNDWPTAVQTIKALRPNFYVKGNDYLKKDDDLTGKIFEEEEAVKSVGGDIHYTDEQHFSSSAIINNFLAPYPQEAKDFLQKFSRRYHASDIIGVLKKVSGIKVLVIGDIIIDEYHYCSGMGKSQKDNIIATRYLNEEIFAGGVLGAANHIAGFINDVTLLSCMGGKNDYQSFIGSRLKPNIRKRLYRQADMYTVVKRRFVDPGFLNKLFEICYIGENAALSRQAESRICAYLNSYLNKFDMVIVTDFGHGLITPRIVDLLCRKAPFLAVNVQTNSSNIGYNLITKFSRLDYVCIDEPELRLACHDRLSDLRSLILQINKKLRCGRIVITRGKNGSLAFSKKQGFVEVPVFSKQVVDTIGAGDAFFSLTAPCVFMGEPMEIVGFIGNAVGAMKVLIVGNRSSVEPIPLFKYISTLLKF